MTLVLLAPAKINWFLSVLGKRTDGYHDIVTLMQCVDLHDTLSFEEHHEVEVLSDMAGLRPDDNLVYRAAMLMRSMAGRGKGARIVLKKEIPIAAGLGGGSSDAACTLKGLNRLWGLDLHTERLRELGATLGSDVPFFIDAVYALAEGRGDLIRPVGIGRELSLVLVNPGIPVSAGWAYKTLLMRLTKKTIDIKLFCQSLERMDFDEIRSVAVNDLEEAVIASYPEIGRIKAELYRQGAVFSAMSGSGSTVFGVFRSEDAAGVASESMKPYWSRVVKTLIN